MDKQVVRVIGQGSSTLSLHIILWAVFRLDLSLNQHCESTLWALYDHRNIWTKLVCGPNYWIRNCNEMHIPLQVRVRWLTFYHHRINAYLAVSNLVLYVTKETLLHYVYRVVGETWELHLMYLDRKNERKLWNVVSWMHIPRQSVDFLSVGIKYCTAL